VSDRQNIYVIDDDAGVRHALELVLAAAHFRVKGFASAGDFLLDPERKTGCLIIDVGMPGINWLEFRIELSRQHHDLVVLVIRSGGEMPEVVGAMRASAMDFVEKPLDTREIITSVRRALNIRTEDHDYAAEVDAAKAKLALLTARERGVAEKLAMGKANKTVAFELGISPRTVEVHRANIMSKLEIDNTSQLVRLVLTAWGLVPKHDIFPQGRRATETDRRPPKL
jgi:two-component system response regulator FixJ